MEISNIEEPNSIRLAAVERALPAGADAKTIVIVDRSIMRRECLAFMLKSQVGEFNFASVSSAGEISADRYDCVLLSIGTSAEDVCQAHADMATVKALIGECPVIAIADCEQPKVALDLLRSGFRGYISTSFEVGLALAAIRLVCFGGTFVPPCAVNFLDGSAAVGLSLSRTNGRELTVREEQVLQHLRSGKPNKTIAHLMGISESTVKVHLQNIMRKMHATNRTEVASRIYDFAFNEAPVDKLIAKVN